MSTEAHKVIVRRLFDEAASQGQFDIIDAAMTANVVYTTSALPVNATCSPWTEVNYLRCGIVFSLQSCPTEIPYAEKLRPRSQSGPLSSYRNVRQSANIGNAKIGGLQTSTLNAHLAQRFRGTAVN